MVKIGEKVSGRNYAGRKNFRFKLIHFFANSFVLLLAFYTFFLIIFNILTFSFELN